MLAASTEIPLSDMAGLYELREELRSDDNAGMDDAMLFMVSDPTEMDEASEAMFGSDSGGIVCIGGRKSALVTGGNMEGCGLRRPGGRPRSPIRGEPIS